MVAAVGWHIACSGEEKRLKNIQEPLIMANLLMIGVTTGLVHPGAFEALN